MEGTRVQHSLGKPALEYGENTCNTVILTAVFMEDGGIQLVENI